jgi:uncharacterized protein (DUF1778 family)
LQTIPKPPASVPDRPRVNVELSPSVLALLDHVCDVTGSTRTQVIVNSLVEALPGLLERSDGLQKRANVIQQAQQQKRK